MEGKNSSGDVSPVFGRRTGDGKSSLPSPESLAGSLVHREACGDV